MWVLSTTGSSANADDFRAFAGTSRRRGHELEGNSTTTGDISLFPCLIPLLVEDVGLSAVGNFDVLIVAVVVILCVVLVGGPLFRLGPLCSQGRPSRDSRGDLGQCLNKHQPAGLSTKGHCKLTSVKGVEVPSAVAFFDATIVNFSLHAIACMGLCASVVTDVPTPNARNDSTKCPSSRTDKSYSKQAS